LYFYHFKAFLSKTTQLEYMEIVINTQLKLRAWKTEDKQQLQRIANNQQTAEELGL
jgi:hypothetical protein